MGFIKHNATNNYTSKLLKVNYSVHECVIIALTVQRACNQTWKVPLCCKCRGVQSAGGKPDGSDWLRRGGIALKHVCGVFAARSCVCVCVCSYRGSFPLVIHTVSLHLSHSHCSEGEERRGGERKQREGCGSGEKESKKRPRDEIRAAECGHGVLEFYHGVFEWCIRGRICEGM